MLASLAVFILSLVPAPLYDIGVLVSGLIYSF